MVTVISRKTTMGYVLKPFRYHLEGLRNRVRGLPQLRRVTRVALLARAGVVLDRITRNFFLF